jgi:lysophospholipase L1-like esterase
MKLRTLLFAALAALTSAPWATADDAFKLHRYDSFKAGRVTEQSIVFVGNSITNMGSWAETFGDDARCLNRGNSGALSGETLENIENWLIGHPAKIFVMIGTNDLGSQISGDVAFANVKALVERVKDESPDTKIYLTSVFPSTVGYRTLADITALNTQYQTLVDNKTVFYLDLYNDLMGITTGTISLDNLHLGPKGYKIWCDKVVSVAGDSTLKSSLIESDQMTNNACGVSSANGMRNQMFCELPSYSNDVWIFGDEMINGGEWHELLGGMANVKNRGWAWGYGGMSIDTYTTVLENMFSTDSSKMSKVAPKQIFFYVGTYELGQSTAAATMKTSYASLIAKAKTLAPNAQIYIMSLTPHWTTATNTLTQQYNEQFQALATETGATYVDIFNPLATASSTPNSAYMPSNYVYGKGYNKIAQILAQYIEGAKAQTDAEFDAQYAAINARNTLGKAVTSAKSVASSATVSAAYKARLQASIDSANALLQGSTAAADSYSAQASSLSTLSSAIQTLSATNSTVDGVDYKFVPISSAAEIEDGKRYVMQVYNTNWDYTFILTHDDTNFTVKLRTDLTDSDLESCIWYAKKLSTAVSCSQTHATDGSGASFQFQSGESTGKYMVLSQPSSTVSTYALGDESTNNTQFEVIKGSDVAANGSALFWMHFYSTASSGTNLVQSLFAATTGAFGHFSCSANAPSYYNSSWSPYVIIYKVEEGTVDYRDSFKEQLASIQEQLKDLNMGNDLGQYSLNYDGWDADIKLLEEMLADDSTTYDELECALALARLQAAVSSVSINTPKFGRYIRVRASDGYVANSTYTSTFNGTPTYLSSTCQENTVNSATDYQAVCVASKTGDNEASTIFYYEPAADSSYGHLLSYPEGRYAYYGSGRMLGFHQGTAAENASVATIVGFQGALAESGAYHLRYGIQGTDIESARVMACSGDGNVVNGGAADAATLKSYVWSNVNLEYVTSLPVSIDANGRASFAAPVAVTVPTVAGAEFFVTTYADGILTIHQVSAGETYAAGTPFLIKAAAGTTVNFAIDYDATSANANYVGEAVHASVALAPFAATEGTTSFIKSAAALAAAPALTSAQVSADTPTVVFSALSEGADVAANSAVIDVPTAVLGESTTQSIAIPVANGSQGGDFLLDLRSGDESGTSGLKTVVVERTSGRQTYDLLGRRLVNRSGLKQVKVQDGKLHID